MNEPVIKPVVLYNNFNFLNIKQPKKIDIEFIFEHNNTSKIKRSNSVKISQLIYVDNIESNNECNLKSLSRRIKRSRYISL